MGENPENMGKIGKISCIIRKKRIKDLFTAGKNSDKIGTQERIEGMYLRILDKRRKYRKKIYLGPLTTAEKAPI